MALLLKTYVGNSVNKNKRKRIKTNETNNKSQRRTTLSPILKSS